MSEAQETSDYPGSLDTWVSLTDKEDLAEVSDINKIKAAVEAVQTELGADPAGTQTDLVTRLARCLADNGAMKQGTSFPGSPNEGDFFYRTDQDVMYIWNGTGWDAQGQSLSSVVFSFAVGGDSSANAYGAILNDSIYAASTEIMALYWCVASATARAILKTKFKKLAGINTLTFYGRVWKRSSTSSDHATLSVTVDPSGSPQSGTVSESDSSSNTTPAWLSSTINVSGYSDGTVYDVDIKLAVSNSSGLACMDSIICYAS